MQKIKIENLYDYNFFSEVNCSPDGKNILFTRSRADETDNNYVSKLYCIDSDTHNIKAITDRDTVRSATWIDNENIIFKISSEGKENETVFYKLNVNGGEAIKFFTVPTKVGSIKVLSDDKYLITEINKAIEEPKPAEHRAEEGKDFLIFDEIPFWANGQGITNKNRNNISIFIKSTGEIKRISEKFTNVIGYTLSEDKTKLLFWGPTYTDMMPIRHELFEHDLGSGYTRKLVDEGLYNIYKAQYFCGKIIFEGSDKKHNSSQNPQLFVVGKDKNISQVAYYDEALGSSVSSDMSYGAGSTFKVIDNKIYCLFTSWGNSYLSVINENFELSYINKTQGAINCFDIARNTAYCVAFRDYNPQEIYAIDLNNGGEKKLTSFSDEFINSHDVVKPEYFVFKNKDGYELEGYVLKPTNYDESKKYPGILTMHGGPKVAFGMLYNHEMQCMASKGYFVFYTNPRGSSGRGDDFSTLVGKLGETDYNDFMEFTDEVINRYPSLDSNRIGICGGSYGGFMCNWMIGNTNRFKAAVSQRSISNYLSKCLTTDIGYYHNLSQVAASPWDNPEKMWNHSPLKYVQNATTPTLFIQSDEDYRCWMSDPIMMFTNLRKRGIPSKMSLFHGENHELSRSGKPHNRINRLLEICNWFDKYLV